MSSVLDAIKRVLGRDHGTHPDSEAAREPANSAQAAATEPAVPTQAQAAEPTLPPTAEEPALATPEEEAELPIQPISPPPHGMPREAALPPMTEPSAEASATLQSTEVERETEPARPQADAAAERLGNGSERDGQVSGVGGEDTIQRIVTEESPAAAEQVTAIKETDEAMVEGPVTDFEGQGQAQAAEPLSRSEYSTSPQYPSPPPSAEPLRTDTAVQRTRPEESPSPEPHVRTEPWSPEMQSELELESESWAPDESP